MSIKVAIPPAVVFAVIVMSVITNLLTGPGTVLANNGQPVIVEKQEASHASECSLSQYYPESVLQWCQVIEEKAAASLLDPNLVAAVILQESGGNPSAISYSGAVGLMQVMPNDGIAATFQCINGPCFASRPSTEELLDPSNNITYGTQMLANLMSKHGNARDALFSYGPMDVGYRYADIILQILNNASS